MLNFNPREVKTPAFVVDTGLLKTNLQILDFVHKETGAKILLALKGFAMYSLAPLISQYLQGTCASSPNEARLGKEEFNGEVHAHAAAFSDSDIKIIAKYSDHIIFNSFSQKERLENMAREINPDISFGIRVNPEESVGSIPLYDPGAPGSRLGVRLETFSKNSLKNIEGLHFHCLCEQNVEPFIKVLNTFQKKFSKYLKPLKWVNFGGGHHITRKDYKIDILCSEINKFKKSYDIDIYLEPGEAVALNSGFLIAEVIDIIDGSDMKIAILNTSAAAHMPDVMEMPYRPDIVDSGKLNEKNFSYRLAGLSCLAGDVIGEYSFDEELKPGSIIVFKDMAHYTMVKTNTFNGINLPDICIFNHETGKIKIIKSFGYEDFKSRL
ncbi:MAG: carboxynorspermidine decarboxylase [Deltaproteobacteria bacterium]|nr:MAG: carboxynorspermidine decarboxylase [Deltaproteobacteria bacterium]